MKKAAQDLYRQYSAGELSGDALLAFEEQLKHDVVFREDFELYKGMESFVEERAKKGAALEVLRGVGRERTNNVVLQQPEEKSGLAKWIYLLVALGLGVLATYVFTKNTIENPISYAELYVEPTWPIVRSGNDDAISMAIAKYLDGDMNSATEELRHLNSDESNYWLAEVYAKEMMHDSVLIYLPTNFKNKVRRDRTYYLKIVTNYKLGIDYKVMKLLTTLPSDTDTYYTDFYRKLGPAK